MNRTTPYTFSSIATPAQVGLRLAGYEDYLATVDVPPGPTVRLSVELLPAYVTNAVAESLLVNIAAAFERRDAQGYQRLLAPGFDFQLRMQDLLPDGSDSLNREQEANLADSLFAPATGTEPAVARVRLTLATTASGLDTRPNHQGWKYYDVSTQLSVQRSDGSGYKILAPQRLYVRQPPEYPGSWRLAEWVDLEAVEPSGVLTWGALRRMELGI